MRLRLLVLVSVAALVAGGVGSARAIALRAAPRPVPEASPTYLLGPNLVRARAVVKTGALHDYAIDRGRIKALAPLSVTLKERDGSTVVIPVAATARIQVNGRAAGFGALRRGMNAILVRDVQSGDAPADVVQASGRALGLNWLISSYFGPTMIRLEAYLKASGELHDYKVDRGRIKAIGPGSLTLRERDDLVVTVPISQTARIKVNTRPVLLSALRKTMDATTVRDGDLPAESVQAIPR